jgi:hypothetical protein
LLLSLELVGERGVREGKSDSEWAERGVFEGLERQIVEVLPWPLEFEESFVTQLRQ